MNEYGLTAFSMADFGYCCKNSCLTSSKKLNARTGAYDTSQIIRQQTSFSVKKLQKNLTKISCAVKSKRPFLMTNSSCSISLVCNPLDLSQLEVLLFDTMYQVIALDEQSEFESF